MKTKHLIPLLFLAFILGCGPDRSYDFWGKKSTIIQKYQDENDHEKKQAVYTIKCVRNDRNDYATVDITLPENFGDVGSVIQFNVSNRTMFAAPELEKY